MRNGRFAVMWPEPPYLIRNMRRAGWTYFSVAGMLAVAVAITTTMFTILDSLVLRPVPFRSPEQLAIVFVRGERGGPTTVSATAYQAWRSLTAFASVEAAASADGTLRTDGGEIVRGMARVSPGVFEMLGGVTPVVGRLFDPFDGVASTEQVVVISEELWRDHYGADPSLVGRSISLNGQRVIVTGVLPAHFRFPQSDTAVWQPASFAPSGESDETRPVVYVRFRDDVPREDALRLATVRAREAGAAYAGSWAHAEPLSAARLDPYFERATPLLAGAVILLFVVLCTNASGLLLVDMGRRVHEFAVRSALGASRSRLVGQASLEIVVAGFGGVVLGVGLSWLLVALSRALLPPAYLLHSLNPVDLDFRALAVSAAAGSCAIAISAVLPALIGTRVDLRRCFNLSGPGRTDTPFARLVSRGLVLAQITFSCVLLLAAAALVRSFVNLARMETGVNATDVLVATVSLPSDSSSTRGSRLAAARVLEEEVRTLPGVTAVSASLGAPPVGGITASGVWASDLSPDNGQRMSAHRFDIGSGFFEVYGLSLLKGRKFDAFDDANTVMVSERLAERLWPASEPVGRTFTIDSIRFTVVGVVKEIRLPSLDATFDRPQLYRPFTGALLIRVGLRCPIKCPDVALVRERLTRSVAGARVTNLGPLENAYLNHTVKPRGAAGVALCFAVAALLAVAFGLYSMLHTGVSRRYDEFGIRAAIGASPATLRWIVWRGALGLIAAGLTLGSAIGALLTPLSKSLLFGVDLNDPLNWLIVAVTLTSTVVMAAWGPASAAGRASPFAMLRSAIRQY